MKSLTFLTISLLTPPHSLSVSLHQTPPPSPNPPLLLCRTAVWRDWKLQEKQLLLWKKNKKTKRKQYVHLIYDTWSDMWNKEKTDANENSQPGGPVGPSASIDWSQQNNMICNQANPIKKWRLHIQIKIHAYAQTHNYATWDLSKTHSFQEKALAAYKREQKSLVCPPQAPLFKFHFPQINHYSKKSLGKQTFLHAGL